MPDSVQLSEQPIAFVFTCSKWCFCGEVGWISWHNNALCLCRVVFLEYRLLFFLSIFFQVQCASAFYISVFAADVSWGVLWWSEVQWASLVLMENWSELSFQVTRT